MRRGGCFGRSKHTWRGNHVTSGSSRVFAIDDGLDELISVMDRICPDTRVFSGCLFLKMCVDIELKNSFFQEWETKGHQEAYGDWRMANGFDLVEPLIRGEPSVTYFDVHTIY